MNKNTVFAIILSFLILLVWSYYMKDKFQPNPNMDRSLPQFKGITQVKEDIKNGYVQLNWEKVKNKAPITYYIYFNENSKVVQFNEPAFYTTNSSINISNLDFSKNYYFIVKAVDANDNMDTNQVQYYYRSKNNNVQISEQIMKYETSLATYQFSTLGGRIKNIILKKYKNIDNSENVNLIYYSQLKDIYNYPLDVKLVNDKNMDDVVFNDLTYYQIASEKNQITFTGTIDNVKITKDYILNENGYDFNLKIKLQLIGKGPVKFNAVAIKWQPILGPENRIDRYDKLTMSYYVMNQMQVVNIKSKEFNKVEYKNEENIKWICFNNRYFVSAIIPEESYFVKNAFFYTDGKKYIDGLISTLKNNKLLKDKEIEFNYTIYAGPKIRDTFRSIKKLNTLEMTIGFNKFISGIGNLFLDGLLYINKLINNLGWAIIIFTILIKLILHPITHKQFESMAKMQKIQPVINQIREQYKNDAQKLNKELMQVYKKYKVNPFSGCLPLLIQIPIFYAIYAMLQYSLELRGASFLWVKNLALPDTVGYLMGISINLLPILMGITMIIQQSLTTVDPKQKSMMYILPLVFLFFFWSMPSGLVLYWTIQNILSIGQQMLLNKYQKFDTTGGLVK